ncbi:MAG: hypothetical protein ACD_15C00117G0001 [uncultured bacterium]|nr:MAG: hypothetical protein ACD_15C00117G0001 [uncultured bacterium]KKT89843.1 MAG: hypothetical protein UW87_C0002G0028 [Candidatus Moranbacteria bacterium GW2011_GWC2_45_10]KKT95198.1 MAG: hypothetical protein UW95_C0003G0040 [Parcubacteria group bacterium GW2011_GWC1_45_14]
MSYKKKIYSTIAFSVFIILLSLALGSPEILGLCEKDDIGCLHKYIDRYNPIFVPLFVFSVPIFIISFLLLFLREQVFYAWKKFAVIYVPISIILIFTASPSGDLLFPSLKEMFIFALPVTFLITSLAIITVKSLKLRKK